MNTMKKSSVAVQTNEATNDPLSRLDYYNPRRQAMRTHNGCRLNRPRRGVLLGPEQRTPPEPVSKRWVITDALRRELTTHYTAMMVIVAKMDHIERKASGEVCGNLPQFEPITAKPHGGMDVGQRAAFKEATRGGQTREQVEAEEAAIIAEGGKLITESASRKLSSKEQDKAQQALTLTSAKAIRDLKDSRSKGARSAS